MTPTHLSMSHEGKEILRQIAKGDRIPPEIVRELLSYDPETGALTWKVDRPAGSRKGAFNARAGDEVRHLDTQGYIATQLHGRKYRGHQLAWAVHHGHWPAKQIDHINGDRSDNRIFNLREVSNAENGWNRGKQRNNTSGFKGVTRATHNPNKWQASIWANKRHKHLGYFDTPEEAGRAYAAAAAEIHGVFSNADR